MNFFKNLLRKLAKASLPIFSFDQDELKFLIDSNDMLGYKIEGFDFKTRHDPYILDAFTIKNKDLFIEHIRQDMDTTWNGASDGIYKSFIRNKLKIKNMQLLKEVEFDNYTFSTYKIDDEFILHLIHIFEMSKDTFIIDTKGKLFTLLLNELQEGGYVYEYENEHKVDINFDISLVKENAIFSYFSHNGG